MTCSMRLPRKQNECALGMTAHLNKYACALCAKIAVCVERHKTTTVNAKPSGQTVFN